MRRGGVGRCGTCSPCKRAGCTAPAVKARRVPVSGAPPPPLTYFQFVATDGKSTRCRGCSPGPSPSQPRWGGVRVCGAGSWGLVKAGGLRSSFFGKAVGRSPRPTRPAGENPAPLPAASPPLFGGSAFSRGRAAFPWTAEPSVALRARGEAEGRSVLPLAASLSGLRGDGEKTNRAPFGERFNLGSKRKAAAAKGCLPRRRQRGSGIGQRGALAKRGLQEDAGNARLLLGFPIPLS